MDTGYLSLTVYFEAPFWVGVVQRHCQGKLTAAKTTFGAEPSDQEVWRWVLGRWHTLHFSPAVKAPIPWRPASPKRAQRQAAQALAEQKFLLRRQKRLEKHRGR